MPPLTYRLLTDDDREEAVLVKVKALEQEHFALTEGFTLFGVPTPYDPNDDPSDPNLAKKQLKRARDARKAEIEDELQNKYHPRVDEIRARAKKNGRPIMEEALRADELKDQKERAEKAWATKPDANDPLPAGPNMGDMHR